MLIYDRCQPVRPTTAPLIEPTAIRAGVGTACADKTQSIVFQAEKQEFDFSRASVASPLQPWPLMLGVDKKGTNSQVGAA